VGDHDKQVSSACSGRYFTYADVGTTVSTLQDLYNNVMVNRNSLILSVGASTGGQAITKIPPVHWNLSEILGDPSYLTDLDFSGAGAAPVNLVKLFISTAPTGGSLFVATTDPVFVLFFDVSVVLSERVSV